MVRRYVDDLFLVLPRTQVEDTLALFNEYHEKLRFTCEREVDGRLPFLDLLVIRDESGLVSVDWYRKPSASDRCMDFRSAHAFSMRVACAKELIGRALRLSSAQYQEDNKLQVRKMLLENGYPSSLVSRLISSWPFGDRGRATDPAGRGDASRNPEEVGTFYAGLTYVERISPKLRVLLEKELPRVKIAFKYNNKISRIHTKLKAPDPVQLQSGVVYKVPCRDCSTSYVGHTISYLKVRMARHGRDCRGRLEDGTMLSHHAIETGHEFDFDNVTIEDRERKRGRREFKEKLHILLTDNCCNKRTDGSPIATVSAQQNRNAHFSFDKEALGYTGCVTNTQRCRNVKGLGMKLAGGKYSSAEGFKSQDSRNARGPQGVQNYTIPSPPSLPLIHRQFLLS
ncbi:unnamed protein product [Nesidiocoris tenuis]|uniref:Helix-turn-helix domain-containing protein n=1 Tax=Nesidiocoris tenuis TaxID=355587 RepID=A0A6H5HFI9_9HEMI|nr:unnamed protein product [Nesidiocoris tenuis]